MPDERSDRIEQLYHAARERGPDERATFLQQVCAGDEALRREVESLLAEDADVRSFLETPALEFMKKMSGEDAGQSLIGRQFGPYSVVSLLAKGGMGEVYRAHDTQLQRDVALKLLPEIFASDAERLARFQREAQVLAALNHPNIAQIYGLEGAGASRCIVMELVEGDTLEERLKRGPIPIKEALAIAEQITEALEAAHEKDIIHRDLKPANVKITPDARVKVLDFGLAKPLEEPIRSSSNSPTFKVTATDAGMILGTAAYMSPEQARGEKVDRRTDMWTFGCVLYELLTGKQAFEGQTVTDTLAAILKTEPDWNRLPTATPAGIRVLLRRCLRKDLTGRLRDAADARIEIQDALISPAAVEPSTSSTIPARRARLRTIPWTVALIAALIAGVAVWNLKLSTPKPIARTVVTLPADERLVGARVPAAVLSPDGTLLAYTASRGGIQQIYFRSIDSLEARPIAGTEGARSPFFSPDSQWLGFANGSGKLKKVAVSGGAPVDIADGFYACWGVNDTIVFTPGATNARNNLWQVSAAGGTSQPLTRLEKGELDHAWPEVLPGGKAVIFTVFTNTNPDDAEIAVQLLDTGQRKVVVKGGTYARYAPSGHLVYIRNGTLLAMPFDLKRLETTGPPVPLLEGVQEGPSGVGQFSIANNGSLVYLPSGTGGADTSTLVWVNRMGVPEPLKAPPRPYRLPRLSSNGQQLAVSIFDAENEIWIYSFAQDTLTKLTFGAGAGNLIWTPDGKRVVFASGGSGPTNLFLKAADGTVDEERLTKGNYPQNPGSFTPDGRSLLFHEVHPTGMEIWVTPLEGDRKPRALHQGATPKLSPDGRFVAYLSAESGRFEVYVQPFPSPGAKYQISTEGAREIVWALNGELFYRVGDKMMAVEIKTQPSLTVGKPHLLFQGYVVNRGEGVPNYDVTADGQRFLMVQPNPQPAASAQIILVQNWLEELKRKVPVK